MPADVCEAKTIRGLIIEKSEGITGSEEEPFALDDVGNEEEEDQGDVADEGVGEETRNDNALVGNANWRGAAGVARADGSVRSARRGRGGGDFRGGSGVTYVSPNQGVSSVFILIISISFSFDGFLIMFAA